LAEGSETYSPGVLQLYRELGLSVLNRWQVRQKQKTDILDKVGELYKRYLKMYAQPETAQGALNPRQMWQSLLYDPEYSGPNVVSLKFLVCLLPVLSFLHVELVYEGCGRESMAK